MSVKVKYKGEQILFLNTDTEKALATEGQYCEGDIVVENVQDGGVTPTLAEVFGTHGDWKVAKIVNLSSVGNGGTCTIDTGVSAKRYMLISLRSANQSNSTNGLQMCMFTPSLLTYGLVVCYKPSTGGGYGNTSSYITDVALNENVLSFKIGSANSQIHACEYLLLYSTV